MINEQVPPKIYTTKSGLYFREDGERLYTSQEVQSICLSVIKDENDKLLRHLVRPTTEGKEPTDNTIAHRVFDAIFEHKLKGDQ